MHERDHCCLYDSGRISVLLSGPLVVTLSWLKAKKAISNGTAEDLNNKVKVTARKAYGFRTFRCHEIALYHALGKLPEPVTTHKLY